MSNEWGQLPTGVTLAVDEADFEADFEADDEVLVPEPEACDSVDETRVVEISTFLSIRGKGNTSCILSGDETRGIEQGNDEFPHHSRL
jgi:hypothetical protein